MSDHQKKKQTTQHFPTIKSPRLQCMCVHVWAHTHTHVKYFFSWFRDPLNPGTVKNWGIHSVRSIMVKGKRQRSCTRMSSQVYSKRRKVYSQVLSGWAHIDITVQMWEC